MKCVRIVGQRSTFPLLLLTHLNEITVQIVLCDSIGGFFQIDTKYIGTVVIYDPVYGVILVFSRLGWSLIDLPI